MWFRSFGVDCTRPSQLRRWYQLRNLIGRTAGPSDPENSSEDFLLHAHVVEAGRVMQLENPTNSGKICRSQLCSFSEHDRCTNCDDRIYVYATELLSLSLLWHGFHDAIKEADGDRILCYWKVLYIVFNNTSHRNYAKEITRNVHIFWEEEGSAYIDQHQGYAGANIPCDLHMEHLNRRLKLVIRSMGGRESNCKCSSCLPSFWRANNSSQPFRSTPILKKTSTLFEIYFMKRRYSQ